MRHNMEEISSWHCWGVIEAQVCFDSGLHINYGISFRDAAWPDLHSTTPSPNNLIEVLALWLSAESCWKRK